MDKGRFPPGTGIKNSHTAPVSFFSPVIFKREGNNDTVSHILPAVSSFPAPISFGFYRAGSSALVGGYTVHTISRFNVLFQNRKYDGSAWHRYCLLLSLYIKYRLFVRILDKNFLLVVGSSRFHKFKGIMIFCAEIKLMVLPMGKGGSLL
ncbi:hypothetical protein HRM2_28960 [Desulforapulum autotrophicum HRM2]|uniref:Uncharacterized protein n=1 Tax=Desulforapulum autotrophicum (strain ATCC 43914 / DSM 3382 / VKM B-1955 / HRM2) TaxID=177437 RepID=C0QJV8_DESAH|nr:hypothetical protein HRM2_28960 [Desulforapulum autotrophicum HRM2]